MKKNRLFIVVLVICLLFGANACGKKADTEEASQRSGETVSWGHANVDVGEATHLTPLIEDAMSERTFTLLVYMIGADLESKSAAATNDIEEITRCKLDSDKINLLVYTGGCSYWHNGIPADGNYLYRYDSKSAEMVKEAATDGIYSMANAQTLTDALDHMTAYYPAEHYGMICWDHGTGSVIGYGSDQLFGSDSLNLPELSAAIGNSTFSKSSRFDFVGFDACLMGSLETAMTMTPFADYLIASEETEPGAGWDYSVLADLDLDGKEDASAFAKKVIDAYGALEETYKNSATRTVPDLTLSCMDLSKTKGVVTALNNLCGEMSGDLDTDFAAVSRIRNRTKEFATGYGLDQIDLGHFSSLAEKKWKTSAGVLRKSVDDLIVYQTTNVAEAEGVSIYFPYTGASLYEDVGTGSLSAIYGEGGYSEFIKSFYAVRKDGQQESFSLGDVTETDQNYVLKLSEDEKALLASASYCVYHKSKVYDSFYELALQDMALEQDGNGDLVIPKTQKAVFWTNAEGAQLLCPARMVENGTDRDGIIARFSAYTDTMYLPWCEYRPCEVRLSFPKDREKAEIQSIRQSDSDSFADRNDLNLENYTDICIFYDHGEVTDTDLNGDAPLYRVWDSHGNALYNYCRIGTDYGFEYRELDTTDSEYVIQLTVKDVFGNEYSSELMAVKNKALYTVFEMDVPGGKVGYHLYDDHAELIRLQGEIRELNIPAEVQGVPVTKVYAYYHEGYINTDSNPHLTSVTFPDTVTDIGVSAFKRCGNLRNVRLPSGLKTIGPQAFAYAPIESIEFPETLELIGASAFYACYNFSFNDDSELEYTGLTTITLPSGIREIGEGAFASCCSLKSIKIANSDRYRTQDGVLFTADGKTLLCYPAGKTDQSYSVPDTVTRIGVGAFGVAQMQTLNVGKVREIAPYAFCYCKNVSSYIMSDTVEDIGAYAFMNEAFLSDSHPDLERFYIGASVERIGEAAFYGARVKEFSVSAKNSHFSARGNMLFDKSGTVLLSVGKHDSETLKVPDGVTVIGRSAFSGCDDISVLEIPDSVCTMEYNSFPSSLERVEIGAGLKNLVDNSSFYDKTQINISPNNPYLHVENGHLVSTEQNKMKKYLRAGAS